MTFKPFSGVITALVTPFKQDGSIDVPAFHKIIAIQKKAGIHGVVVLGTTGENPTLTSEESNTLVLEALKYQDETFHVYVGTGTNDTSSTIEKSVFFGNLKTPDGKTPKGIMVVTPYYNKPSQRHLIHHYKSVCDAVAHVPVCLYNVPGRTGVNILPATLAEIAKQNQNLVAIKEAAGNLNAISEMRIALDQCERSNVLILSGDDPTFCPAMLCGASGVISVTTHVIPKTMIAIWNAVSSGDTHTARQLHLKSYPLNQGIFSVPNPVGVKWMLSELGLCENVLRAPLCPAEKSEADFLNHILSSCRSDDDKFF